MSPRGHARGAPIAVQIVAFLIGGLMLAQAVNLAIVLLVPPPTSPIYQLGDVASALQGRGLQSRLGRPLVRSIGDAPTQPALFRLSDLAGQLRRRVMDAQGPRPRPWGGGSGPGRGPARRVEAVRHELAQLLGLADAKVRLWLPDVPPWAVGRALRRPEPREPGPGPQPPPGAETPGGPPGPPWSRPDPAQRPLVADFVAAAQAPDGRWITVRPLPEPFPNVWQRGIMLWFIGWLAVFAAAAFLFARRLTAPIGAFARAAEQLGLDPQGAPLALRGPAELGVAARAFNEMQVRIKRYVNDRTAMVGAISHDLRTPLTRIRFKVENADPALRAAVLSDVDQMEAMISAVLVFIRDANTPTQREPLDLLSLLECEVDAAALVGAQVVMDESAPVVINADALGLQRLFGNLIDNAVKYGGGARVSLATEGAEAVVRVTDEGPGLSPADLERAFDPFFRGEPSRNRDSGGVGLGLAVARSIARGHGGDLVLEPQPKGLAAVVRLPLPAKA